jgi:hypothetical protein
MNAKILVGVIGLCSILLGEQRSMKVSEAIQLMLPQYRSVDNGGSLPAIDAYRDGIGIMVDGYILDNSAMNTLVFKYGTSAKTSGLNIADEVLKVGGTPTALDITLANKLKTDTINACDDNNPATIDYSVAGVCFNDAMSCLNGYSGSIGASIDCSGVTGIDFSKWSGLTSVNGDIRFAGGNNFSSLSGLYSLSSLNGYLAIIGNSNIHNLSGLTSLTSLSALLIQDSTITDLSAINGITLNNNPGPDSWGAGGITGFAMINNTATTIPSFPNATRFASLVVTDNPGLTTMSGFTGLSKIDLKLNILRNNNMQHLNNFNALTEVGNSAFNINSIYIDISNNNGLLDITGFQGLKNIYGLLNIQFNNSLTSISGFNQILSITRQLQIENNPALTSITGFGSLNKIVGMLYLKNNPVLSNISGFSGLRNVDGIYFETSPLIKDLSPLNGVQSTTFFVVDQNIAYTTKLSATSYLCVGMRAGTIPTNIPLAEIGKVCY